MVNDRIIWTTQEQIEMERFCDLMATFIEKYGDLIDVDNVGISEVVDNATSFFIYPRCCILQYHDAII